LKRENLWAPWRIGYIQGLADDRHAKPQDKADRGKKKACFICQVRRDRAEDDKNLVLWRSPRCMVILNRFPYNNGHLLIAPLRHIPDLHKATEQELLEIFNLLRDAQRALSLAIAPHGFNVGMNFGRCAGAGLPDHLHVHLVPRWDGDTNFMDVCSNTDVISQSLQELLAQLKQISKEHNLPRLSDA